MILRPPQTAGGKNMSVHLGLWQKALITERPGVAANWFSKGNKLNASQLHAWLSGHSIMRVKPNFVMLNKPRIVNHQLIWSKCASEAVSGFGSEHILIPEAWTIKEHCEHTNGSAILWYYIGNMSSNKQKRMRQQYMLILQWKHRTIKCLCFIPICICLQLNFSRTVSAPVQLYQPRSTPYPCC